MHLIPGSGRALGKWMVTHASTLAWEFHGQRGLEGYSPWDHKEMDRTEVTAQTHTYTHITAYNYISIFWINTFSVLEIDLLEIAMGQLYSIILLTEVRCSSEIRLQQQRKSEGLWHMVIVLWTDHVDNLLANRVSVRYQEKLSSDLVNECNLDGTEKD